MLAYIMLSTKYAEIYLIPSVVLSQKHLCAVESPSLRRCELLIAITPATVIPKLFFHIIRAPVILLQKFQLRKAVSNHLLFIKNI